MSLDLTPEVAWALATGGPWPDPEALEGDARFMALALREGLKGVGLSSPNPPVGCVLVKEGRVLGAGVHTRAGDPHGEIMALRDAEARDEDVRGATAYVTLEPCCHQGRTGPCTLALLQAGITRVVVGVARSQPPGGRRRPGHPPGPGPGTVEEGVLGEACARFHAPFFKLIHTGLPWVSLKLALGSDGSLGPAGRTTPSHAAGRSSAWATPCAGPRKPSWWAATPPKWTIPSSRTAGPRPPPPTGPSTGWSWTMPARCPPDARVWQPVAGQPALRAVTGDPEPLRGVEDLRLPPGPRGCSLRHLLHELPPGAWAGCSWKAAAPWPGPSWTRASVDEFHRFQSDLPAGGTPWPLPLPPIGASGPGPGGRVAAGKSGARSHLGLALSQSWHDP